MNTKNTKVNIPDWIFNPGLDSGDRTGGFTSPATKPNESDVEILIREAIQNSKDKITSNTNILNFNIRFYELTNKNKENFLKKIKWSSLHQHIYNASNESSNLKENNILKEGLKNINSKTKPLRILVLEDNICKGLTGDDEDENGNFNLLTKTDYVTPETSKRGGSYGVGKTKILNCSSIRTLLFSSIPIDNEKRKQNKKDVRLFGRCILPTHKINNKTFHSAGYFGLSDKDNKKAISFYDTNLSKDILVERDLSTTGTTIAVVGFHEPKHSSTNRSIGTIIEDLDHAIQKNY